MSQTERLVYITQRLKEYGRIEIRGISEKFEVDSRTVKRDIEYLRERCDSDIRYDRKTRTYLAAKPVDIFSPGRALLFYAYTTAMARSLSLLPVVAEEINKKAAMLLDSAHTALAGSIHYRFPSIESFDSCIIDELLQAFREHLACEIKYAKPGKDEEKRLIEPLRFINYDGQWYVLAFCRASGAKRQFSLSRIHSAARTHIPYSCDIDNDELDRIVESGYGIMRTAFAETEPVWVTIRFSCKSADIVSGQEWHALQKTETCRDGSLLMSIPVESYEEIARRVLFFADEAEAIAPADFREIWLGKIREMHKKFCGN